MTTDYDLFSADPNAALLALVDPQCFDDTGRRVRVPHIELEALAIPCDHCGKTVTSACMTIANVTDFGRVNMTAFHAFCCSAHRDAWWAAGHEGDFWRVSEEPRDLLESDRGLQLNVIHYDGPGVHDQIMALRNPYTGAVLHWTPGDLVLCVVLDSPVDLNRWWSTPDVLTVAVNVEILYSKAA